MNDIEQKIGSWRKRLSAALPAQEETIRELEEHLRDHLAALTRRGVAPDEAFAQAVAKLGDVQALAQEFGRLETGWRAISWPVGAVLILVTATLASLVVLLGLRYHDGKLTPLLAAHVLTISAGYVAALGAGLVGAVVITSGWIRLPSTSERMMQRRTLFRLAALGSICTPLGLGLGMVWSAQNRGHAWSWAPVEVGAVSVLISTWLLLAQLRAILDDRVRAVLALLGATVVGLGWFGAQALTSVVPIAWLCLAAILSQGAVALLHARSRREAAEDRLRTAGE